MGGGAVLVAERLEVATVDVDDTAVAGMNFLHQLLLWVAVNTGLNSRAASEICGQEQNVILP